jgi:hypothetical protein
VRNYERHYLLFCSLFIYCGLFLFVFANAIVVTAQVQNSSNPTATKEMGVKITSPTANSTIPVWQLVIRGISSDTPETNCIVSVDWNDLKPMQNVTASGPAGLDDYSNWTFAYTDAYHIISEGTNELTSKITCYDNPANITNKFYSIDVTGMNNNTGPSSFSLPTSN